MSIQYLFIIDFEGKDIIDISNQTDPLIQDLKDISKNSKDFCINEMKNKIIDYKKNLEKENISYKLFAKKNGDMVITGIITDSNYKDHHANSFIEKILKKIKKFDLENNTEIKLLKKEVIQIFEKEQKKLNSTKIVLSKISEIDSKISNLKNKAIINTVALNDLDFETFEIGEKAGQIGIGAKGVKEEARKYRNQVYLFLFGLIIVVVVIVLLWVLNFEDV